MRKKTSIEDVSSRILARIIRHIETTTRLKNEYESQRNQLQQELIEIRDGLVSTHIEPHRIISASPLLFKIWNSINKSKLERNLAQKHRTQAIIKTIQKLNKDIVENDETIRRLEYIRIVWPSAHTKLRRPISDNRLNRAHEHKLLTEMHSALSLKNERTHLFILTVTRILSALEVFQSDQAADKRTWTDHKYSGERDKVKIKPKRFKPPLIAPDNIFLPIPNMMKPFPMKSYGLELWDSEKGSYGFAGFKYGKRDVGRIASVYQKILVDPVSKTYVPKGASLEKSRRFLPLAYRSTPYLFGFYRDDDYSSGFNIHQAFDSATWDHIRTMNRAKTGSRCQLCGGVSNQMTEVLPHSSRSRIFRVENHEVWSWKVPSDETPVGIQKLERIFVVCFRCHMTFHESQFIRFIDAGIKNGLNLQKESLLDQLMEHRSFLTRLSVSDVKSYMAHLDASTKEFRHITDWIIDLTHLTKQDYSVQLVPHLKDDNERHARISADHIAGISFYDQKGNLHVAKSPEKAYELISAKYRQDRTLKF